MNCLSFLSDSCIIIIHENKIRSEVLTEGHVDHFSPYNYIPKDYLLDYYFLLGNFMMMYIVNCGFLR